MTKALNGGKIHLTNAEVMRLALELVRKILALTSLTSSGRFIRVYGVPRGGVPVLYVLLAQARAFSHLGLVAVEDPGSADVIVDDIIDSGATKKRFTEAFPRTPFFGLIERETFGPGWVVFPWEQREDGSDDEGVEDNIRRLLQYVGEDPSREGLLETPKRVSKAWKHWCQGYHQDPVAVLKTFGDGAEGTDEMVIVRNIELYSHCEHHMAPFFGVAHVAYIPDKRIVGLSKLARVTDIFAQRLQVQERLTNQIADCIQETLRPVGVGVVIEAKHFCMCSRGVGKQGSTTITSALRGAIKDKPAARAEFLALAKS